MKTIIKYLLIASLVFSLKGWAQQDPRDTRALSDKTSFKGQRELKKEMKIRKRSEKNAKHQQTKSVKKNPVRNYTVGKRKKSKVITKKTRNREKRAKVPAESAGEK